MSKNMFSKTNDKPFIMHLEKVVRLIDMGQKFTVESNPCSRVGDIKGKILSNVKIDIGDRGVTNMSLPNGTGFSLYDLSLATYKRIWRCWQNGTPTDEQRKNIKWG